MTAHSGSGKARVLLMGELRLMARNGEFEVEMADNATVLSLLRSLSTAWGKAVASRVLTREGGLSPLVAVFLDGEDVRSLPGGAETALPSGGRVEICMLPMYEGGSGCSGNDQQPSTEEGHRGD